MAQAGDATGVAEPGQQSPDSTDQDEVAITRTSLRNGGWLGYGNDGLYVKRDGKVKIRDEDITRITLRAIEWDLVVMSLLLVGVGGYVAATRNPLVGVGFAVAGLLSLYRTYRKRYALSVHVGNDGPLTVYPTHPKRCHERLADRIE
ncbi:hypothetical protein [Halococcus salsus]|uniref:hypothetical protein n=1 Tax=Halococcus salsus TaxID=2162894 RepID=UPI00135B2F16|nr:hypothetical protein [Halococcus salsus]